jgi:hypothetical protein
LIAQLEGSNGCQKRQSEFLRLVMWAYGLRQPVKAHVADSDAIAAGAICAFGEFGH